MTRKLMAVLGVAVMLSLGTGGSWGSSVTSYTSESSFTAQLQPGYYLEDFNYAPWTTIANSPISTPQTFTGGVWTYAISSPAGLSGQPVPPPSGPEGGVANYQQGQAVTVTFTGLIKPTAVGGIFWDTDINGNSISNGVVTITLANGGTYSYSDSSNWNAFTGFTSDAPISSMTLSAGYFATMDHLYVGTAAVPLPAAVGIGFSMLGGFGALFGIRKRLARRPRIA